MLRRFQRWRFVAASSISLFLVLTICARKSYPAFKYAVFNTDGYDIPDIITEEKAEEITIHIPIANTLMDIEYSTEELGGIESNFTMHNQINDEFAAFDETLLLLMTIEKLREKLHCFNRSFERRITQRGDYWIYINYIRAEHGPMACHEDVTMTSHSDFTFLDNLDPQVDRFVT